MSETTKVEQKQEGSYKPEDFAKAYEELCNKMGFRIVVSPNFLSRDDGTFSVVLNYTVGKLPQKE